MSLFKEYGLYTVFINHELLNKISENRFMKKFMMGLPHIDLRKIKREEYLYKKLDELDNLFNEGVEENQIILISINQINDNDLKEKIIELSKNNFVINFIKIEKDTLLKHIILISDISTGVIYYNNPKNLRFIIEKTIYNRNYIDKKYNNFYLWNFRYYIYKLICR